MRRSCAEYSTSRGLCVNPDEWCGTFRLPPADTLIDMGESLSSKMLSRTLCVIDVIVLHKASLIGSSLIGGYGYGRDCGTNVIISEPVIKSVAGAVDICV